MLPFRLEEAHIIHNSWPQVSLCPKTQQSSFDVNETPVRTRVTVDEVEPGKKGQRIGLQVGDQILSYDGEEVPDTHMYQEKELLKGEYQRELRIQRGGRVVNIDVPAGRITGVELFDKVPSL